MRKRGAEDESIDQREIKKRRIESSEDAPVSNSSNMEIEDSCSLGIDSLPFDIIGNAIFKYFSFSFWIRSLICVNKQWYQTAIQSSADKQLVIDGGNDKQMSNYYLAASKFRVTAIIVKNRALSGGRLTSFLNASPKLHTYLHYRPDNSNLRVTFPFIKTVFTHISALHKFPSATRVQLADSSIIHVTGQFPNVEELAVNDISNIKRLLDIFPSLKVLHVSPEVTKEELDPIPPSIQVVIAPSQYDSRNWWKYYSYDQLIGNYRTISPLQYSMSVYQDQSKFEEIAERTSLEYERDLMDRDIEYKFPLVSFELMAFDDIPRIQKAHGTFWNSYAVPDDPAKFQLYANYMPPINALNLMLRHKQYQIATEFLSAHAQEFKEMSPDLVCAVVTSIDATKLVEILSKEQLAKLMLAQDDKGTLVHHFIMLDKTQEDLTAAIVNFGELPTDWPTIKNKENKTPLAMAVHKKSIDWMKFLITKGAKVDIGQFFQSFPSYDLNEITETIRVIEKEKAYEGKTNWLFDSDWRMKPRITADLIDFFVEEFKYDLKTIKRQDENERYNERSFIVHLVHSSTDLSTKLLEKIVNKYDLDVNQQDKNGWTPLLVAISHRRLLAVQWLLENGARPTGSRELTSVVSPYTKEERKKHRPSSDTLEFIDLLLAFGADINAVNDDVNSKRLTALWCAVHYNQPIEVVEYLIARGARTDITDHAGQTLLHCAVKSRNAEMVNLVAKYVDINKTDNDGRAPLHLAINKAKYRKERMYIPLLKLGADVNQVRRGITPLMRASMAGYFDVIPELLKYNVNFQAVTSNGHSFVHYLARYQHSNRTYISESDLLPNIKKYAETMKDEDVAFIIAEAKKYVELAAKDASICHNIFRYCKSHVMLTEFFIEHLGIDVNVQDFTGNVLMSYALDQDVFDYLLTKNPNVNIQNMYGETPLMLARDRGETEAIYNALIEQSKKHSNELLQEIFNRRVFF